MARVLCAGSFICDLVAAGLPRIGAPGDLVYAPRGIELCAGGHAVNVSIDLAQLGERDVAAAGCVGDDPLGDFLEEALRRRGVKTYTERLGDVHTAKNLVLVVEGEDRRFFAELAANTMLSPGHLLSALEDARPDLLFLGTVGGLKVLDPHLHEVLDAARRRRCLTVVDVVMPHGEGWSRLASALPLIDVLHCNDLEASTLTGARDPGAAADVLIDEGACLALISMGARGLVAATEALKLEVPPFKVDAVDPTGAGDALCAGVIHAILDAPIDRERLPAVSLDVLKRVLLEGAAAGAACVTAPGATAAVTRGAVDRLIREQGELVWSASRLL
ncbi:hypothetical protein DRO42_02935 [Candidatus Bathyarchaeota archaeon]|nr:MAG: hypothetical protein DRO42_02935 [Candidatus Bathyarchaeota archaeon]